MSTAAVVSLDRSEEGYKDRSSEFISSPLPEWIWSDVDACDLTNHRLVKPTRTLASALARMAAIKNYVAIHGADGDKTAGWWVIPEVVCLYRDENSVWCAHSESQRPSPCHSE